MNDEQVNEFNDKWENIIYELTDYSKKIEGDLLEQHQAERRRLDEEIAKIQIPPPKYSPALLDDKFKLSQLIKQKNYTSAKYLKENIEKRQEEEEIAWQERFIGQLEKRKELLFKKQKNEYEALKTRLEKSINSKLKQRMAEYEKLLQRIQNLQNELIIKQSLEFSKIQATNAKILAKYALNLNDMQEKFIGKLKRQSYNSNKFN